MKRQTLIASAVTMLLVAGNCWAAASTQGCISSGGKANGCPSETIPVTGAPEIDIGAGGGAIALLVGALLLAGEKRRHSS